MRATLRSGHRSGPLKSSCIFVLKRSLCLVGSALLLAGCAWRGSTVLGKEPGGSAVSVAAVRGLPEQTPVVVRGTIVEKCPVAGCWFFLRDTSGVMKVDTKSAGFVVLEVPLGTTVSVGGHTGGSGDVRVVNASGIRY